MQPLRKLSIGLVVLSVLAACGGDDGATNPPDPDPTREWTKIATLNHDGPGSAVVEFGGQVVVGGDFESINGAAFDHLARWNGEAWSALPGVSSAGITSLIVHGGRLIAEGGLRLDGSADTNPVAAWDGSQWAALDLDRSWSVSAIASASGILYAAGSEWTGHEWEPHFYRWNGTSWQTQSPPYPENLTARAHAMGEWNGSLIVSYSNNDQSGRWARVARLEGSNWIDIGERFASDIEAPYIAAFEVFNGVLYAGGYFDHVGDETARRIARLTGTAWEPVGDGFIGDSGVRDLAVFDGRLVAAGDFRSADGTLRDVAAWDGTSWSAIGQPWMAEVNAVGVFGEHLIATGPDYVAQW